MRLTLDNWRQGLRDGANRAGLPRFWRWWIGELAPLLPAASRVAIRRRFARPVIELAEGEAVFWRPDFGDGRTRLAVVERVSLIADSDAVLAAGRAAVARLAANASGGIAAPKVAIALSPKKVLRKELSLPAAVEENLAQTLAYDLDRHTPFRPEQVYFDAVVVSRDTARKMLRIDWAAALKTVVDDARKLVEGWGAVPVAVIPGPPGTSTRLNLIPDIARPRPLNWHRWQVWAPLAAVVVLALAAVFVPLVQKRQYAIALNVLNAEAAQQAQVADGVRRQLEGLQNDYNYILAKKYTYPSTVDIVDAVTRALPDDTWLTQMEVKTSGRGKEAQQRDVYLRGESENAGKLIALLEDTKLVEQAAPRSPTTKIQGGNGEIFDLTSRLRTLAPPQAEPVSLVRNEAPPPAAAARSAAAVPAAPAVPAPQAGSEAATAAPAAATPATVAAPAAPTPAPAPVAAPAPAPAAADDGTTYARPTQRLPPALRGQRLGMPAPAQAPVPPPAAAAPPPQSAPAAVAPAPEAQPETEAPPADAPPQEED